MKIESDKYYRIRHIPTGLYKSEGLNGRFTKEGKMWLGGRLKAHLRLFEDYSVRKGRITLVDAIDDAWTTGRMGFGPCHPIAECELIEVEMTEKRKQPVSEFIEEELSHG